MLASDYDFSTQPELERKTMERLDYLCNEHDRGEISDLFLTRSLHDIDSITRGLIDSEITETIDNILCCLPKLEANIQYVREVNIWGRTQKKLYRKKHGYKVVHMGYDEESFRNVKEFDDAKEAREFFNFEEYPPE